MSADKLHIKLLQSRIQKFEELIEMQDKEIELYKQEARIQEKIIECIRKVDKKESKFILTCQNCGKKYDSSIYKIDAEDKRFNCDYCGYEVISKSGKVFYGAER